MFVAAVCVNHIPEQVYLRSLIDPETDREGTFLSHTKSLHFEISDKLLYSKLQDYKWNGKKFNIYCKIL